MGCTNVGGGDPTLELMNEILREAVCSLARDFCPKELSGAERAQKEYEIRQDMLTKREGIIVTNDDALRKLIDDQRRIVSEFSLDKRTFFVHFDNPLDEQVMVLFPEGWRIGAARIESIEFYDDQDRLRAQITRDSTNAPFGSLKVMRRYHIEVAYRGDNMSIVDSVVVVDYDGEFYARFEPQFLKLPDGLPMEELTRKLVELAEDWMDNYHPFWRNPFACWD